jgi:hypothetical protein
VRMALGATAASSNAIAMVKRAIRSPANARVRRERNVPMHAQWVSEFSCIRLIESFTDKFPSSKSFACSTAIMCIESARQWSPAHRQLTKRISLMSRLFPGGTTGFRNMDSVPVLAVVQNI